MKKDVMNEQIVNFMNNAKNYLDLNAGSPLFNSLTVMIKRCKPFLEVYTDAQANIQAENAFINAQGLVEFENLPNGGRSYKVKPEQHTKVREQLKALDKKLVSIEPYYATKVDFFGAGNKEKGIVKLELAYSWKDVFTPFVIPETEEDYKKMMDEVNPPKQPKAA